MTYSISANAGDSSVKTFHLVKTQFKAITAISGVSNATPVVVTTATAHGLTTSTQVTITGVVGSVSLTVSAASNATPIAITTTTPHLLANGSTVTISGCTGNTGANGVWVITLVDATHFTLNTSVGTGTGSNGTILAPYNTANGNWTITSTGTYTFSLNSSTGSGTYVSGGSVLSPATQYWTDSDIPIYTTDTGIGGLNQLWTPVPFQLGAITYQGGTMSGTSMTVQNADNSMSALVYNPLTIKMVPIDLYEAWLDPTATTALVSGGLGTDIKKLFSGIISSGVLNRSGDQAIATYTLDLSVDPNAIVLPRRIMSNKCSLIFRGKACQYAGQVETCYRTYVTCKTLGNQANYGGFLAIPTAKN